MQVYRFQIDPKKNNGGPKGFWKRKAVRSLFLAVFLGLGLFLNACGGEKSGALQQQDREISSQLVYESSMELTYAEGFAVDYYQDGYVLLTIRDGSRFLVVPEGRSAPEDIPEDIAVLARPLTNLYLVATAVMDMFRELDGLDAIRFSGQKAEGWYIEEARAAMEEGRILYAGKYSMPDYELILSEGCSLAIENTMISHTPEVEEKLEEFGIPVLVDYSSYETHPLGRVEWIRLYGALLGKEEEAKACFQAQEDIVKRILEELDGAAEESAGERPSAAFFYLTANGSVNVRKASDYIPKMIGLAGGSYVFDDLGEETDKKSSVNMQMEEFYQQAREADYLIYNSTIDGGPASLGELLQKDGILEDFKAVKEGKVFCTTSDLYQQSMSIGAFIEDLYRMLSGDEGLQAQMQYIYRLK